MKVDGCLNLLYLRIQSDYEKETNGAYDKSIPLYKLEPHTKEFLEAICANVDNIKFKDELLLFPNWATDSPIYKCGDDYFTHIKLKKKIV